MTLYLKVIPLTCGKKKWRTITLERSATFPTAEPLAAIEEHVTIMKKLSFERPQRIFNGIVSLVLLVWILAIREHVYYASGIREHYKFELLIFLFGLYLMQAFSNKKWLNSMLIIVYSILIGYVLYTYVYAFFDIDDNVMDKQNGILIKTLQILIKLTVLFIALWLTKRTRPS